MFVEDGYSTVELEDLDGVLLLDNPGRREEGLREGIVVEIRRVPVVDKSAERSWGGSFEQEVTRVVVEKMGAERAAVADHARGATVAEVVEDSLVERDAVPRKDPEPEGRIGVARSHMQVQVGESHRDRRFRDLHAPSHHALHASRHKNYNQSENCSVVLVVEEAVGVRNYTT